MEKERGAVGGFQEKCLEEDGESGVLKKAPLREAKRHVVGKKMWRDHHRFTMERGFTKGPWGPSKPSPPGPATVVTVGVERFSKHL